MIRKMSSISLDKMVEKCEGKIDMTSLKYGIEDLNNILDIYRDYLVDSHLNIIDLDEIERGKYKYNPVLLSYDVYKTPDLAFLILHASGVPSALDFDLEKEVKMINPTGVAKLMQIVQEENNR